MDMNNELRVAVQMDPVSTINPDSDSTFALMEEAQARGHHLWFYEVHQMSLQEGKAGPNGLWKERLTAMAFPVRVLRGFEVHYEFIGQAARIDLGEDIDVVLMRQDPPFDMAYITATHFLEHIHPRTLVVNDPGSVRNAPEKLLVTHFPDLMPPTLLSRDLAAIRAFRALQRDIVVKPLFEFGGSGVFRIRENDENFGSLLEMIFARSPQPLVFQRYEPAVRKGDKRILLIDGKPVGAINRVPVDGDARSNMHVGGMPEAAELTARDLYICSRVAPYLRNRGILLAGIDVIGEYLTEINVTSPTGLQELRRFNGTNAAATIWEAIEGRAVLINRAETRPLLTDATLGSAVVAIPPHAPLDSSAAVSPSL